MKLTSQETAVLNRYRRYVYEVCGIEIGIEDAIRRMISEKGAEMEIKITKMKNGDT